MQRLGSYPLSEAKALGRPPGKIPGGSNPVPIATIAQMLISSLIRFQPIDPITVVIEQLRFSGRRRSHWLRLLGSWLHGRIRDVRSAQFSEPLHL